MHTLLWLGQQARAWLVELLAAQAVSIVCQVRCHTTGTSILSSWRRYLELESFRLLRVWSIHYAKERQYGNYFGVRRLNKERPLLGKDTRIGRTEGNMNNVRVAWQDGSCLVTG